MNFLAGTYKQSGTHLGIRLLLITKKQEQIYQDGYTLNSSVSHQTYPPLSGKNLKPIILRAYALRTPGPGKRSTFFPLFGRRKSFEYLIIYDRAGCLPVNMTYTFVKTVIFISAVFVLQCLADVCTLLWSMKAYTQNYLRVLLTVSLTHSISSMLL